MPRTMVRGGAERRPPIDVEFSDGMDKAQKQSSEMDQLAANVLPPCDQEEE